MLEGGDDTLEWTLELVVTAAERLGEAVKFDPAEFGGTYVVAVSVVVVVLPRLDGAMVGASMGGGGGNVVVGRESMAKREEESAGGIKSSHEPVPKEVPCAVESVGHASAAPAAPPRAEETL